MKKIIKFLTLIFIGLILVGCSNSNNNSSIVETSPITNSSTIEEHEESITDKEVDKMYITIGEYKFEVKLSNNSSSKALVDKLKEGSLTLYLSDYGNFEKVGNLGFTLPRNDERITTTLGDVILYLGNQFSIYYDTNTWSFTR